MNQGLNGNFDLVRLNALFLILSVMHRVGPWRAMREYLPRFGS
jgi:hypothetical protein